MVLPADRRASSIDIVGADTIAGHERQVRRQYQFAVNSRARAFPPILIPATAAIPSPSNSVASGANVIINDRIPHADVAGDTLFYTGAGTLQSWRAPARAPFTQGAGNDHFSNIETFSVGATPATRSFPRAGHHSSPATPHGHPPRRRRFRQHEPRRLTVVFSLAPGPRPATSALSPIT